MIRKNALFRWFLSSLALATVAFSCAARANLPTLWAYLAVITASNLVSVLLVHPVLLEERSNPGGNGLDPFVGRRASFLFLPTVAIAALDSGRLHWTTNIEASTQTFALALLAAMTGLQIWSMAVNPFFCTEILLQAERGHHLVTRGPYRFVRHPGYLAMLFTMPATAIALGSWLAPIPALFYSALILRRTTREDIFLRNQLPGYLGYARSVRYKIPGFR